MAYRIIGDKYTPYAGVITYKWKVHNGKIEIISLVAYICSDLIHYVIQAFVHIVSEIMGVV